MDIVYTKYEMATSGLDPPLATDYTYGPTNQLNTYGDDKRMQYIGQSTDGGTMIIW
jgi:hypothetical protein